MFCSKCGREIPDDARFCSYCGCEVYSGEEWVPLEDLEELKLVKVQ
jgi:RNA polymerase subunit RPABC4/transcription elongation factor Spt4